MDSIECEAKPRLVTVISMAAAPPITVRFLSLDKQVRCRPDFGTKVRLWNGSTPSGLDL